MADTKPTVTIPDADAPMELVCEDIEVGEGAEVIEHQLDVIKSADWIIDLGPEGGEKGGQVVVSGTPEQVVRNRKSHTARALAKVLRNGNAG